MVAGETADALARLRTGRERALADYYTTHQPQLLRMVDRRLDRRLSRRVDPADVLQESYVEASQRLGEYLSDPSMPLILWVRFLVKQRICAIHRRHFGAEKRDARREVRHSGWEAAGSESAAVAAQLSASITSPSKAVAREELQQRMRKFIDQLEPFDREVLLLRHFDELSNNEVAYELGLTKSAASKRYLRALSRLREVAVGQFSGVVVS